MLVREPRFPPSRVPSTVHDCDDTDEIWKDAIDNRKSFRLPTEEIETLVRGMHEFRAEASATALVPEGGFGDVSLRFVARDDTQTHKLARMRSRAMCHGVPLSGCASSASSRRSSSAICSAERSSRWLFDVNAGHRGVTVAVSWRGK